MTDDTGMMPKALPPEEYERMEQAWERAAAGAPTDAIARDLGITDADLRLRMQRAGMPLSSARQAHRDTLAEQRAEAAPAGERRRTRIPNEVLQLAVQEVLDGGPDVNVSRIAHAYSLRPVSLNAAVRKRLAQEGRADLSSAVARHEHKEAMVAEVKRRMAKGQSMLDACQEMEVPYATVAKAISRERMIERFQRVRARMLAEGATEDDLAVLGVEYRHHRQRVLVDGQTLTDWLGPIFRHAAATNGETPDRFAPAFALWLAGKY